MVELISLSAGYRKKAVLTDVDLRFESGYVTSVIGVNGSGKSTLIKTAAGILPALCGEVRLDGADIAALSHTERARRVAYLPQTRNLSDMTVMSLVLHGRFPYLGFPRRYTDSDRAVALRMLEVVGIPDLASRPLAELSGGQRQKAYLAMALCQETENLLLDEPTSFLDVSCRIDLWNLCRRLAGEGKCVVCVSHDIAEALKYSDRVALFDGGNLKAYATPSELVGSGALDAAFGVRITHLGGMEIKIEK